MNHLYLSPAFPVCYANDNDALIPEVWSQMGLMILEENMVAANLVHRDFENEIKNYGDVVNTRRPGTAKIRRRKDGVAVEQQDAVATNVRVPLDQWFYSSFTIKDGEASLSFQDLVQLHLLPHAQNIARAVDRAVVGRIHEFMALSNRVGRLGNLDSSNSKDYALEAREKLNINKVNPMGRNLLLSPTSETAFLKNELFLKADSRGDGGSALENARLGRILGFDTFMGQNVNSVSGADSVTGTVTNALASGGSGSQTVSITGYEVSIGEFAVVAGNDQPTIVTAATASTDTTAVTLNEANKYGTSGGAVITVYKKCAVKGDFTAGHIEHIVVDGHTANKGPQVGQLIAFGTGAGRHTYTILEVEAVSTTETKIWLDRPLVANLSNDAAAFPGPNGSMNWAFYRDALALVTRPLALPDQAMGVKAGIATHNNVSMRVTMQYDLKAGGTLVNMDILAGVAVLDPDQAILLLG